MKIYRKLYSPKEYKRMTEEYDKVKYTCKCGHRVIIPKWVDKNLCDWCNRYVYKDKKQEFKERLEEEIRRNARKNI